MSIQTEINRLNTAKTNILNSIKNKGVDTSSAETLSDVSPLIDSITTNEDLSTELNNYEIYLSTQETTIQDIISALQNKIMSGGKDMVDALLEHRLEGFYSNDRITSIGYGTFYNDTKLTEEECNLLRDIINMTLSS